MINLQKLSFEEIWKNSAIKYSLICLSLIYFALSLLNLMNWGLYWDDWWLNSLSNADLHETYRQVGIPLFGYLHLILRKSPFPLIVTYRAAQFLCGYLTLIFVYFIFLKGIIKNAYWSFWGTAFFIALPLNFPKITLICFPYILCTAFFYFSFVVALLKKDQIRFRIMAHIFFFLSFFTNSFIVIYAAFLIVLYIQEEKLSQMRSFKYFYLFIKNNFDFILLPILFAALKYTVFPAPSIEYAGYNSVILSDKFFPETLNAFQTTLESIIPLNIKTELIIGSFFILTILGSYLSQIKNKYFYVPVNNFFKILFCFIFFTFLSIAPYILVGRTGANYGAEWTGRDTLLVPFGFSLFFISIILIPLSSIYLRNIYLKKLLGFGIPTTLLLIFSFGTIKGEISLIRDTIKQDAILNFMRTEPGLSSNKTFIFEDRTLNDNALKREYRSYELNGMANSIFGNQERLFLTSFSKTTNEACPPNFKLGRICKDWKDDGIIKRIIITYSPGSDLKAKKIFSLIFLKITNHEKYLSKLSNYYVAKLE